MPRAVERSSIYQRLSGQKPLREPHTTAFERFLLMATIVVLPLQDHLPAIGGFSISFLTFGVLAVYVILRRPHALSKVWRHPVFLASYGFVVTAILIESIHPNPYYAEIIRIGYMVAGAVFIAALYRDRQALQWGLYGYLIAGIWLSCFIFLTSYGILSSAMATSFDKASQIRARVFAESGLHADLNGMAFIAAQGAVVALALALTTKAPGRRKAFLGIVVVCAVAVLMTMSRGGAAIAVISLATIILAHQAKSLKTIAMVVVLGVGVLMLAPSVVFSRLTLSSEAHFSKDEIRANLYRATLRHMDEYIVSGVGAGNFWNSWGLQSAFAVRHPKFGLQVGGAHNIFVNIMVYWGLIGLFAIVVIFLQAYRCIPKRCGADQQSLCLLGLTVIMFLISLLVETFALKDFSLGLGILVGTRCWIWPRGIIQPTLQRGRYINPYLQKPITLHQ